MRRPSLRLLRPYRLIRGFAPSAALAAQLVACATPSAPPPPRVEEPAPPIIVKPAPGKKRVPVDPGPPPDAMPEGDDDEHHGAPPARADDARGDEEVPARDAPPPRPAEGGARPKAFDPKRTMTVHVLDVGQGAATLIEMPCGVVLVDTGGEVNERFDGPRALVEQLDAFFAGRPDLGRTIDLLVLTHPHIDHVRGVPALLDRFAVKHVVDNGRPGDEVVAEQMKRLRAFTDELGRRYRAVVDVPKQGLADAVIDPLKCAPVDPKIRVLAGARTVDPGWGRDRFGHSYFANENNHSVVVRVDFGEASVLITGDLEETALRDLVAQHRGTKLLDVDVYAVGHHGSANGTTQELLDAMTPDLAFIQMGDPGRRLDWTAWQYGHPRQKVVDLLEGEVRLRRAAVDVEVGTGQRRFDTVRVERAVYGTGWEGLVVVDMTADGRVHVRPTRRYVDDGPR